MLGLPIRVPDLFPLLGPTEVGGSSQHRVPMLWAPGLGVESSLGVLGLAPCLGQWFYLRFRTD